MQYKYPNTKILLFSKAPIAGKCKSRLVPLLGENGAARLQEKLIHKILFDLYDYKLCPFEIWESEPTNYFTELNLGFKVNVKTQQGDNLGERMSHAMSDSLTGCENVMIIGSDCIEFTKEYITSAIQYLLNDDVVIGPAHDGGYLLIGMSQPSPEIFNEIKWGDSNVYKNTLRNVAGLGLSCGKLKALHDIDCPDDIVKVKKNMPELLIMDDVFFHEIQSVSDTKDFHTKTMEFQEVK